MTRLLLSFTLCIFGLWGYSQELQERSLHYYIEAANENSPLIKDFRNFDLSEMTNADLRVLADRHLFAFI